MKYDIYEIYDIQWMCIFMYVYMYVHIYVCIYAHILKTKSATLQKIKAKIADKARNKPV